MGPKLSQWYPFCASKCRFSKLLQVLEIRTKQIKMSCWYCH